MQFVTIILIIFNIICISNLVFAQVSTSQPLTKQTRKAGINELEKQMSFRVYGLSSEKDANKLIKGLRDINEIVDCNLTSNILYVISTEKFPSSKILYSLNKLGFKAVEINNESEKLIPEKNKNDIADQKKLNPEQQRALEIYGTLGRYPTDEGRNKAREADDHKRKLKSIEKRITYLKEQRKIAANNGNSTSEYDITLKELNVRLLELRSKL